MTLTIFTDIGRVNGKGEDDLIVTVAGRDDVDAASTYSLFMEKDFRYYFQHPYCRLFFCYFVVFCNFLIYAEDPVAHSIKECLIPMIGNTFAFVGTRYPPDAWSLLKVFLWLVGIGIGMVIGKLFVHGFLFSKYIFGKCSKISNNLLFHFSNNIMVVRASINKRLVKLANEEAVWSASALFV